MSARPAKALPPIPPPNDADSAERPDSSRPSRSSSSLHRKPVPSFAQHPSIPSFSINEHDDTVVGGRDSRQSGSLSSSTGHSRSTSRETPDIGHYRDSGYSIPVTRDIPIRQTHINDGSYRSRYSQAAKMDTTNSQDGESTYSPRDQYQPPYYSQQPTPPAATHANRDTVQSPSSDSQHSSSDNSGRNIYSFSPDGPLQVPRSAVPRPSSAYTLGSELNIPGNTQSRRLSVGGSPVSSGSPNPYARQTSTSRRSPDPRPSSYIDLLNLPYNQQIAPAANLGNAALRGAVGQNASLLDTKKTLDMYRGNVKKTQDSAVQYEFALFMIQVAREITAEGPSTDDHGLAPAEMLREARQILQKLADRSYPFAQYYLADGYASGLFNKDKPDYDRAFPLFVAATKHGHAEAGYRAALCYEFGWGCRKDYAKAVQFFRAAASKNHPGAATRLGKGKYREGVKWLKRASESADFQYNNAPYELGLLHETGYGDDIFKDEIYAVQLFTQAAELGHAMAALKLGEAYEHGLLRCPKDAALSVHYYNCAAQADIPEAMMNLCAWYMVGAEPVLDKDENEAYEWAKKAAKHEMGIGCRRDPLEANVWYVQAADHGDERAKQRLAIIQAAASGQSHLPNNGDKNKLKKGAKDENCIVM
ncbi:HCP-like protein [Cucurbitaria berberidis CBS 394.84]|uniref:HCP-like protein n=1 Tax=Cucurbitaria berberidis CBS 394.84 TaxID=1168544 RepID=A0A9P4L3R1_9PLEO|nr:HCP-like protein [Cucurbitaria berberidis CBS 394.84]KAF1840038.1 HCP-like protein [Cucurbitaria berberidis CBS 394.84]